MVLTGFFDSLMVAKLGHVELAASGICNSIFFLISIFPMGVTMAYATIISLLLGRNKIKITHLLVRDSFYVTYVLKDGPAYKGGVQLGDILLKANDSIKLSINFEIKARRVIKFGKLSDHKCLIAELSL